MNTRILVLILVACVAGSQSALCASGTVTNLLIMGMRGELYTVPLAGQKREAALLTAKWLGGDSFPDNVCYVPSQKQLIVVAAGFWLWVLDLSNLTNGFQRVAGDIIAEIKEYQYTAFFDRKARQPAWFHPGTQFYSPTVHYIGQDKRVHTSCADDINFQGGDAARRFSMFIDGPKTSAALAAKYVCLAALPAAYPDALWRITGRSEGVIVYGKDGFDVLKDGEPINTTCIFIDRVRGRTSVHTFDQSCDFDVYEEAAVSKGMNSTKGGPPVDTMHGFSGNWYFYIAAKNEILSRKLDTSITVHYATGSYAVLSRAGELLILGLDAENEQPTRIATLPAGLSIVAVCPYECAE